MIHKKTLGLFSILLFSSMVSIAQIKKETTTVKVDIQPDTIFKITKAQKSITQGSVTVEGKRINYTAISRHPHS